MRIVIQKCGLAYTYFKTVLVAGIRIPEKKPAQLLRISKKCPGPVLILPEKLRPRGVPLFKKREDPLSLSGHKRAYYPPGFQIFVRRFVWSFHLKPHFPNTGLEG